MSYRILIADDDNDIRSMLRKMIDSLIPNIKIIEVYEGEKVLPVYIKFKPDLVTLDYHFANYEFTGLDILKQIIDHNSKANVIMVAGQSEDTLLECKNAGAIKYFHKPFAPDELCNFIQKELKKIS